MIISHSSCICGVLVIFQEKIRFFREITERARDGTPEGEKRLLHLVDSPEFIQLIKNTWQQCRTQELLQQQKDLPPQVEASLEVIAYLSV